MSNSDSFGVPEKLKTAQPNALRSKQTQENLNYRSEQAEISQESQITPQKQVISPEIDWVSEQIETRSWLPTNKIIINYLI